MFPALVMVNLLAPLLLAVNRSPDPDWSTITAAFVVAPENDAVGVVAILPLTSSVASGVAAPIPTLPVLTVCNSKFPVPFASRLSVSLAFDEVAERAAPDPAALDANDNPVILLLADAKLIWKPVPAVPASLPWNKNDPVPFVWNVAPILLSAPFVQYNGGFPVVPGSTLI